MRDHRERNDLTSGTVWKKLVIFFLPIAAHIHDKISVHKRFSVLIAVFKIRIFFQRFHMLCLY